jgi:hypothetical protein
VNIFRHFKRPPMPEPTAPATPNEALLNAAAQVMQSGKEAVQEVRIRKASRELADLQYQIELATMKRRHGDSSGGS